MRSPCQAIFYSRRNFFLVGGSKLGAPNERKQGYGSGDDLEQQRTSFSEACRKPGGYSKRRVSGRISAGWQTFWPALLKAVSEVTRGRNSRKLQGPSAMNDTPTGRSVRCPPRERLVREG